MKCAFYATHITLYKIPMETFVTRYSKRYLTALASSNWYGMNEGLLFSHKRAAVSSSPEVQYDRMQAIIQPLLVMLMIFAEKGRMFLKCVLTT